MHQPWKSQSVRLFTSQVYAWSEALWFASKLNGHTQTPYMPPFKPADTLTGTTCPWAHSKTTTNRNQEELIFTNITSIIITSIENSTASWDVNEAVLSWPLSSTDTNKKILPTAENMNIKPAYEKCTRNVRSTMGQRQIPQALRTKNSRQGSGLAKKDEETKTKEKKRKEQRTIWGIHIKHHTLVPKNTIHQWRVEIIKNPQRKQPDNK